MEKTIKDVNEKEIIAVLDQNNPSWYFDYASKSQLKELAQGFGSKEALKTKVIRNLWPICQATYTAIIIKSGKP